MVFCFSAMLGDVGFRLNSLEVATLLSLIIFESFIVFNYLDGGIQIEGRHRLGSGIFPSDKSLMVHELL